MSNASYQRETQTEYLISFEIIAKKVGNREKFVEHYIINNNNGINDNLLST